MRRSPRWRAVRTGLSTLAALALVASLPAPSRAAAPTKPTASYIVVLRPGASPDNVVAHLDRPVTVRDRFRTVINGFAADLDAGTRAQLSTSPDVTDVVPDAPVRLHQSRPALSRASTSYQILPSAVVRVGALQSPTAHIDGQDQRVKADIAIVDSGIGQHPDLNVVGGTSCVGGSARSDGFGHGTALAGLAAAKDNHSGIVGVAPGARLWSVKVFDDHGAGSVGAVVCGLEWVANHAKTIDVANLSWGDVDPAVGGNCGFAPASIDVVHQSICKIVQRGVVAVAAAGNDSADTAGVSPAGYPEVITVSALADGDGQPGGLDTQNLSYCAPSEHDDTFATFSNFGAAVDVAAPGVCILSTAPGGSLVFGEMGTSFSAPLVSGAAALVKAKHPKWTPAQVRDQIVGTANGLPIPGDPDTFPEGVLNVTGF